MIGYICGHVSFCFHLPRSRSAPSPNRCPPPLALLHSPFPSFISLPSLSPFFPSPRPPTAPRPPSSSLFPSFSSLSAHTALALLPLPYLPVPSPSPSPSLLAPSIAEFAPSALFCSHHKSVHHDLDLRLDDQRRGIYNYERMFKSVVKLFEKSTDAWVIDTPAFYQRHVFGSLDGSVDDSPGEEDDEDSDVSAILALRAARDTPSNDSLSQAILLWPPSKIIANLRINCCIALLTLLCTLSRTRIVSKDACCIVPNDPPLLFM
ncbi:hypothetical protein DFH07DRAFT_1023951 [Mycena maculata]|uniref:Uncharacterized protein n=1 Tax=Mycena maculata TaxID=230809 RepID=A0AAD7J894_9AGAR|nr:hypothetical protein DFH07DRAFT_1023951 [Mycena maculata]